MKSRGRGLNPFSLGPPGAAIAMDLEVARELASEIGLTVEKKRISFLNRLFPHLLNDLEVILICHISPEEQTKKTTPKSDNEGATELLDVTGSPLKHSFGDDSFNVSISSVKRNWMKSEEKYTPIYLRMACEMLSCTEEKLTSLALWSRPLFALADPEENDENCVIVGRIPSPDGFIPVRARLGGVATLSDIQTSIQMEMPLILHNSEEMNPNSRKKPRVRVSTVYEVTGVDPEIMEFKDEEVELFGGYFKVETNWEELSFLPPLRKSQSYVIISLVTGSNESPLESLWNQLVLLERFLEMLEDYQRRHMSSRYSVAPLHFSEDFVNVFGVGEGEIMGKIQGILRGDDVFGDPEGMEEVEGSNEDDYQVKLGDLVRILEKKQGGDFISGLWRILRGVQSYNVMTDCVHMVFEGVLGDGVKGMGLGDTRIGRIFGGVGEGKIGLPQLAGSVSMELVVDLGIEKLIRDYEFLVNGGNLMEVGEVGGGGGNVAEGEFDVGRYREKLMGLAQIHVSLEFLQLIQSQLNCRMDVSRSIFESAMKMYKGPNSPLKLEDLKNPVIYSLKAPAPKDIISEVIRTPPASWMCTITTDTKQQSFSSITHYSRTPIFPPNIYTPEDIQKVEGESDEAMYHATTGSIIHFKLS